LKQPIYHDLGSAPGRRYPRCDFNWKVDTKG
jgi:hypothetical protein